MLFCVRTTLNLDDALMRDAKKRAAEIGTTLTRVIEDALRRSLSEPREDPGRVPFRLPVFKGPLGMAPGVSPEDVNSNARIAEIEERGGA